MHNPETPSTTTTDSLDLSEEFVWDTYVLASREHRGLPHSSADLREHLSVSASPSSTATGALSQAPPSVLPNPDAVADLFYTALLLVYRYAWRRCERLPHRDLIAEDVSQDVLVREWSHCLQDGSLSDSFRIHLLTVTCHQLESRIEHLNRKSTHSRGVVVALGHTKTIQPKTILPDSHEPHRPNDLQSAHSHNISDLPPPTKKVNHGGRPSD